MELRRICKDNYVVFMLIDDWIGQRWHGINLQYNRKQKKSIDTSLECGIIRVTYNAALKEVSMDKRRPADPKEKALRDCGAFNTHPVADALFKDNDFFDPRDLVQVKYEMLRKVHQDREPASHAAASFGFSRPSFYKTSVDFEREGIAGLLPRKRGPRGGHKLTGEVLAFIEEMCAVEQPMGIPVLLEELEKRFGIKVHRRSLERARRRCEKKNASGSRKQGSPAPVSKDEALVDRYEEIRRALLGRHRAVTMWGQAVLRTRGMTAWARLWWEHGEGRSRPAPSEPSVAPSHLPANSEEVVRLLAGMVWAIQEEALS